MSPAKLPLGSRVDAPALAISSSGSGTLHRQTESSCPSPRTASPWTSAQPDGLLRIRRQGVV